MGYAPFSVFTYAAIKAAREVLGEQPTVIQNQCSLQTRHFPLKEGRKERNLVGDWLFGPLQVRCVRPRSRVCVHAQRGPDGVVVCVYVWVWGGGPQHEYLLPFLRRLVLR